MNESDSSTAVSGAHLKFVEKTKMNFATVYTDAHVETSAHGNSNGSGTTLKEHDYIGLSEVSSANSSSDKHPECGLREVIDLNESATVLRLGPPSALKPLGMSNGKDQQSRTFSDVTDCYRVVPEAAADLERSRAGSKLDRLVTQDGNVTVENTAKRVAYHHDQKHDEREPVAEPMFAKSLLGGIQRNNAILQEFRKAQAMKAAQQPLHAQMMKSYPNRPMHNRPQDHEAGLQSKHSTGFHAPYNVFPGVKNNGVKRAFSEAVGMNLGGSSITAGPPREGHGEGMGGNDQADVKVKSQQGKTWMGVVSLGNNSPAWHNLSLDKSNGSHNPFNVRRTLMNKSLQDAGDLSNKVNNDVNKLNETTAPVTNDESPPPA